jgi:hypothetical protein
METKLIGHKSGTKIVFTDKVATLYKAKTIQSMNTLKYSYKQAQYNTKTIRLNNLQTLQYKPEK